MESIISTFHIDWKIIIAQAFNFGVVFVVLYIFALKPLSKLMKERTEKISKGIDDAKNNAQVLERTKKEYEEVLNKARKEAHDISQAGKKEEEKKRAEALEATKIEVSKMIENGKKSLEAEKVKIVADAKKEVVSLVVATAEKLLGEHNKAFEAKAIKELNNL